VSAELQPVKCLPALLLTPAQHQHTLNTSVACALCTRYAGANHDQEVALTLGMAYLAYWVTGVPCKGSGVCACAMSGAPTRAHTTAVAASLHPPKQRTTHTQHLPPQASWRWP
jgi:hypothetical protein